MGFEKIWIIAAVCLLGCFVGFKQFVWFMSIGYGLSIALAGIALPILFYSNLSLTTFVQCVVLIAYGARLAGFLYKREMQSYSYKKAMKGVIDKDVPLFVKIVMWTVIALYYTIQVTPVFYRLYNGSTDLFVPWIGIFISICGIIIEALSDKQKSEQKAKNPNAVAMEGLYKFCRCPNYFGELLMWLGVLIGGFTTYQGIGQWGLAVLAFLCICIVMIDGAKRLEKRQYARCGKDPVFQKYCDTTPIIVPGIPIYHLNKVEKII